MATRGEDTTAGRSGEIEMTGGRKSELESWEPRFQEDKNVNLLERGYGVIMLLLA